MKKFVHLILSICAILILALSGSTARTSAADFQGSNRNVVPVAANETDQLGSRLTTDQVSTKAVLLNPHKYPPVITEGDSANYAICEEQVLNFPLHATDEDGNPLTWSIYTSPSLGVATVSPESGATTTVIYTPVVDYTGDDWFIVQVSDDLDGVDTIFVEVQIGCNKPPVITQGISTSFTVCENEGISLPLDATDPDGDPLTWTILTLPANGDATVSPSNGPSTIVKYTPKAGFSGDDYFAVQVSDGDDGADTFSASGTIHCNHAPIITQGESTPLKVSKDLDQNILLDANDADRDDLSWTISMQASHGNAKVPPEIGPSTTVVYTPDPGYTGKDNFDVQVSDGQGGVDTISIGVEITINLPPIIGEGASINFTMCKGQELNIPLHASDPDGDALTWSISKPPTNGDITISPSIVGAITIKYTPKANYIGDDAFVVQVSDGRGGVDKISVGVKIQFCLYHPCAINILCFDSPQEIEPNNSPAAANGSLCFNREYQGNLNENDLEDWFYFDLSDTATVRVELENVPDNSVQLYVYHDKKEVDWKYKIPYFIDIPNAEPGRYEIRVLIEPGLNNDYSYNLEVIK